MDTDQILALEAFSSDSFLVVNKTLIKVFGLQEAVFLSNLIDKYRYFYQRGMLQEDGGFFLTFEQQSEQIGLSSHQLRKCKKSIESEKILKTYKKGIPSKEFYILNMKQLVDIIKETEYTSRPLKSEGLDPLKSEGLYKDNKYKDNKYKNNIVSEEKTTRRKRKNTSVKNKEYSLLTKKLKTIVETNFGRTLPINTNIKSWTTQLRLLHEHDGIPVNKIKEVMNWYKEYAGTEYIPECQSGGAFRSKFEKLEAALFRTTKQKKKKTKIVGLSEEESWEGYGRTVEI